MVLGQLPLPYRLGTRPSWAQLVSLPSQPTTLTAQDDVKPQPGRALRCSPPARGPRAALASLEVRDRAKAGVLGAAGDHGTGKGTHGHVMGQCRLKWAHLFPGLGRQRWGHAVVRLRFTGSDPSQRSRSQSP